MGTLMSSQTTVFIVVCEKRTFSFSRIEYVAGESQGSREGVAKEAFSESMALGKPHYQRINLYNKVQRNE